MSAGRPFASFLAAMLVLLPLPWHWRARNIPILSIITWLFMLNMIYGVNAIVWHHNVEIKLIVWCDITTKLNVGANIALPAACFCLCMHLESVASGRRVSTSSSDKRRRMLVDLALCFGIPIIYMALHYVVQGHLFDIVEDFGCRPEDYVSIPEFFLMWLMPILLCLGTFLLSGLAFFHFLRRRAMFARLLSDSRSALTPARYFRLMAMSVVEMFWALLVISFNLYFNYRNGLRPWISWANVHSNFSNINLFPLLFIPPADLRWTYFLWWTTPVSAYMFFAFFAFGADAMKEYMACVRWFRRCVLLRKDDASKGTQLGSFAPVSPCTLSSPKPQFVMVDVKTTIEYISNGPFSTTTTLPSYTSMDESEDFQHVDVTATDSSPSRAITSLDIVPPPAVLSRERRSQSFFCYSQTDQVV